MWVVSRLNTKGWALVESDLFLNTASFTFTRTRIIFHLNYFTSSKTRRSTVLLLQVNMDNLTITTHALNLHLLNYNLTDGI